MADGACACSLVCLFVHAFSNLPEGFADALRSHSPMGDTLGTPAKTGEALGPHGMTAVVGAHSEGLSGRQSHCYLCPLPATTSLSEQGKETVNLPVILKHET